MSARQPFASRIDVRWASTVSINEVIATQNAGPSFLVTRLNALKGPDREGVVAVVTGSMVRVRWPSEQETTVIPAPGTLTVLSSTGDQAPMALRPERPTKKRPPRRVGHG